MTNNKKFIIIGAIVFFVFGSLFYWYEWRPSQIRKECYESAIKNPFKDSNATESERRNELNFIYQNCLKMSGLEK